VQGLGCAQPAARLPAVLQRPRPAILGRPRPAEPDDGLLDRAKVAVYLVLTAQRRGFRCGALPAPVFDPRACGSRALCELTATFTRYLTNAGYRPGGRGPPARRHGGGPKGPPIGWEPGRCHWRASVTAPPTWWGHRLCGRPAASWPAAGSGLGTTAASRD